MKPSDWIIDAFFLIGLGGIGAGVYELFGRGWALCVVGIILLTVSIYGSREP